MTQLFFQSFCTKKWSFKICRNFFFSKFQIKNWGRSLGPTPGGGWRVEGGTIAFSSFPTRGIYYICFKKKRFEKIGQKFSIVLKSCYFLAFVWFMWTLVRNTQTNFFLQHFTWCMFSKNKFHVHLEYFKKKIWTRKIPKSCELKYLVLYSN